MENKKKMGRPKSDNPKNNNIKVKVDDDLFNKIKEFTSEKNITVAEFIRQSIYHFLKK